MSLCAPGQTLTSEAVRGSLSDTEQSCLQPLPPPPGWSRSLGGLYEVVPGSALGGDEPAADLTARTQHVPVAPPDPGTVSTGSRRIQLTRHHRKRPAAGEAEPSGEGTRLCLLRGPDVFLVDARHPLIALGREIGNDLIVDSPTASRRHAQIEWRPDGFFLVDHSWNGTYVYDEQGHETQVHNAECRLQDSGFISPGRPGAHAEAEVLRFVEAR